MTPLLQMQHISKSFFGVKVLDDVSIDLNTGEVLALLGENGAGKSTLIKILNGDYSRDGGDILIDGQMVEVDSPRTAEMLGIRMIYQELHYAPDLSVAENLMLGHLPTHGKGLGRWLVDWREVRRQAQSHLDLLKIRIDPDTPMRNLTVVEREIVEIVKALSSNARILVMDEPTAALTPPEVRQLFSLIDELRANGVGIIYISHRLDEIYQVAQRVTVLRDGKRVDTRPVSEVTHGALVQMMVGREIEERELAHTHQPEVRREVALELRNLTREGAFSNINLKVHAGEIVGLFGLLGAGHVALTRSIFGAERADSGQVLVSGEPQTIRSPRDGQRAGIGFVPIDRKVNGLVLDMSVRANTTLSNWKQLAPLGVFKGPLERAHTQQWVDRLGIRMAGGSEVYTRFLSGGNQQKVVLARWLEANVRVLLLNEPTWGVDVGARSDIYDQLDTLADQGLAILLVSSDIEEVLSVSHRIHTIYKGRLTGEFMQAEATQEKLLHAAAGGTS